MCRTEQWILWSFHLAHPKSMELQNPKYLSRVSWKPLERSYRLGKGNQEEVRLVTFREHLTDLRYGNEARNILPKSPRVKEAFIAIDLSEIYINIFIFLYSPISLLIIYMICQREVYVMPLPLLCFIGFLCIADSSYYKFQCYVIWHIKIHDYFFLLWIVSILNKIILV